MKRTGASDVHGDHTGEDVSVYIIDSGIQADHPDLEGNLGTGHAVVECHKTGGETCVAPWDDDHGHGTHVAGTAAAADNEQVVGVAPEATLHAVKVIDRRGRGWTSDIIAGIDWVAEREADKTTTTPAVANVSLGRTGSKDGVCDGDGYEGSDSYYQAICEATQQGVVFAVAAGNSGEDADGTVPAAYSDTVLTVSATQCELEGDDGQTCKEGTDAFAGFSNYGEAITVGAPGVDVLSTWIDSGYHEGSGTSMASPHVAGAAALLIGNEQVTDSGYGAFTSAQQIIGDTAEDTQGWPKLDADGNEVDGNHDEGFLDVDAAVGGSSS